MITMVPQQVNASQKTLRRYKKYHVLITILALMAIGSTVMPAYQISSATLLQDTQHDITDRNNPLLLGSVSQNSTGRDEEETKEEEAPITENEEEEIAVDDHHNDNVDNASSFLPVKAFVPWKQRKEGVPLPCVIDRHRPPGWDPFNGYIQKQPTDAGLLYIKIEKAASSTLASVAARTAIAIAERTHANTTRDDGTEVRRICRVRGLSHLWSKRSKNFQKRDNDKTFLWTFLKDPTRRLLSFYFFFHLDWYPGLHNHTEESFIDFFDLDNPELGTGMFKALQPQSSPSWLESLQQMNDTDLSQVIQETIDAFDFLGLVERMDESLVLLSFMLDLPVTDVLYQDAKLTGGKVYFFNEKQCRRVGYRRPLLPKMQAHIESEQFADAIRVDRMIYDAVNRSIDRTIENVIGRERFDASMLEFQEAKAAVDKHCANKIFIKCGDGVDENVKLSKCYLQDMGCGYECMAEIFPLDKAGLF